MTTIRRDRYRDDGTGNREDGTGTRGMNPLVPVPELLFYGYTDYYSYLNLSCDIEMDNKTKKYIFYKFIFNLIGPN